MPRKGEAAGRFGYTNYTHTRLFTHREWAWEFLRENSNLANDWLATRDNFTLVQSSASRWTLTERQSSFVLSRWGLRYASTPNADSRSATVFWAPETAAAVLRMYALCRCKALDTPPLFHLDDVACPVTRLVGADGIQHLLFAENGHALQVRVAGDAVEQPVYLFAEAAVDPRRGPAQHRALRCFVDLRRTGHLLDQHFPPDPQGLRRDELWRTFDLARTVPHQRNIAERLYGTARVEADWPNLQSGMQDHVRKTLRTANGLVQGKYRRWLSY